MSDSSPIAMCIMLADDYVIFDLYNCSLWDYVYVVIN